MDLPWATRVGLTAHYGSAVPLTMTLPEAGTPGEIFRTDVTGDGTTFLAVWQRGQSAPRDIMGALIGPSGAGFDSCGAATTRLTS
jgi:hypothetical protein